MFANPEIETMDREELAALQLDRLKKTLRWAGEKSPFYRAKYEAAGVDVTEISTFEDFDRIPFLTSVELNSCAPFDRLTLPLSSVLRVASLPQGPGKEVLACYTNADIAANVSMMARALAAGGVTRASLVGVLGEMSDSRLLDLQYALELLGATVVPLGAQSGRWMTVLRAVGIDTIVSGAQLAMQLIIEAQAEGGDLSDSPLRTVFLLTENGIQNPISRHIMMRLKTKVYSLYAPAELASAGMLYGCSAQQGQHLQEDMFYPELIAFGTQQPVREDGQMGELVVTTLAAQAMPLIRYRTGQAVSFSREPCSCGRTFLRVCTPFSPI